MSLSSQLTKLVGQMFYQVMLARLLSPADVGLVAMVGPVIALMQLFTELGLSQATVQRRNIDSGELSFLFWVSLLAGASVAVCTAFFAPVVANFYGEPRLTAVTVACASTLIFAGASSQHLALMNRDFRFGSMATVDLLSFLAGAVSGLSAAAGGFGYWSIVITQVITGLAMTVLSSCLSGWRPQAPKMVPGWRGLLGFGGNITGFNLANFFARNADNVLIARFNGDVALGLYDRAYRLLLMPLTQIAGPMSKVAVPLLSRSLESPATYRKAFSRVLEAVLLLTYPGVAFAIAAHEQLIELVLGKKWLGVAPIFAVLGVGGFFAPVGFSTGWLFISQDRTRQMRNWGVVSSVLFTVAFVCGLPWGPTGVATCYICTGIAIQAPLVIRAATQEGPVSARLLLGAVVPHALAALICFGVTIWLTTWLPPSWFSLLIEVAISYGMYSCLLMVSPRGRGILVDLWLLGRPILERGK